MAKLGSYKSTEKKECPIDVFLESTKGQFTCWNKEEKKNDMHELDRFIVLTVGFTVKGKVWDDNVKQYTSTYFSNEITHFNETIYAIQMTFNNGGVQKMLKAKGNWKLDVKNNLPQGIGIRTGITVLDLNDGLVKEIFLPSTQYFGDNGIQGFLDKTNATSILSLSIIKKYTDGVRDNNGQEKMISESELDKMKGSEAAKYKNRYIYDIKALDEETSESMIEEAEKKLGLVDNYHEEKKAFYDKTYGDGGSEEGQTDNKGYAPEPKGIESDDEFEDKVRRENDIKQEAKDSERTVNKTEETISVEDIPFS